MFYCGISPKLIDTIKYKLFMFIEMLNILGFLKKYHLD